MCEDRAVGLGADNRMAAPAQETGPLQQEVYKQLCEDHRYFSDMRFKQLTLWSGATALTINAGFSDKSALALDMHPVMVPTIGALLTGVFWIMEIRSTLQGVEAFERKVRLETASAPKTHWTFVNRTNITALLYVVSYLFWWALMFQRRAGTPFAAHTWIYAVGACGIMLIGYTVREYWDLWLHARARWRW